MIYSKKVTTSHSLCLRYRQAIALLSTLLKEEGSKKNFFTDELVLNLDTVEILIKRSCGSREETMDFCMGLSSNQMLLVELKLRVLEPKNLKRKDLENKIRYSKCLLGEEISVSREKVFLFNDKVIEVARRNLSRLFNNNPNLKVYTVEEFRKLYFD